VEHLFNWNGLSGTGKSLSKCYEKLWLTGTPAYLETGTEFYIFD
jgi:hypothetical protein